MCLLNLHSGLCLRYATLSKGMMLHLPKFRLESGCGRRSGNNKPHRQMGVRLLINDLAGAEIEGVGVGQSLVKMH